MVGCGDDETAGCTEDSDCDPGEVCGAGNTCSTECTSDEDCDAETGNFCSRTCPEAGAYCFQSCTDDEDCDGNQVCDTTFCGGQGICKVESATSCTTNEDCDEGLVCDTIAGECIEGCSETGCDVGFVCNPNTDLCQATGSACTDNDDCDEGESCDSGACVPVETCEGQSECYEEGSELFCAAISTSTNACVDTSCGVSFNACTRCTSGPNSGSRDEDGPSIFSATQNDIGDGSANCKNDLTVCQPDAPILCEFQFYAFSPNGADLPTSGVNDNIWYISGSGSSSKSFGGVHSTDGENAVYRTRACFPEGGGSTVGTALYLESVSGKKSNTLCVNATK